MRATADLAGAARCDASACRRLRSYGFVLSVVGAVAGRPRRSAAGHHAASSSRSSASGLDDFREIEEPSEGLGPLFNGTGCASCHNVPVIGGSSPMTELRAGRRDADGKFRVVGGTTLFQMFSIPDHRCQAVIPAGSQRHRAADVDPAVRRRPDRSDSRRDAAGARRSVRSRSRRHQRPRRHRHRRGHRPAARRPLRMEGAGRHAADVLGRRVHQRDGDHERHVSRSSRAAGISRGATARMRSGAAIPKTSSTRAPASARSTTSRRS